MEVKILKLVMRIFLQVYLVDYFQQKRFCQKSIMIMIYIYFFPVMDIRLF